MRIQDLNLLTIDLEYVDALAPKADAVVWGIVSGLELQSRNLLRVCIRESQIEILLNELVLVHGEKICFNSFYFRVSDQQVEILSMSVSSKKAEGVRQSRYVLWVKNACIDLTEF